MWLSSLTSTQRASVLLWRTRGLTWRMTHVRITKQTDVTNVFVPQNAFWRRKKKLQMSHHSPLKPQSAPTHTSGRHWRVLPPLQAERSVSHIFQTRPTNFVTETCDGEDFTMTCRLFSSEPQMTMIYNCFHRLSSTKPVNWKMLECSFRSKPSQPVF